MAMGARDIGFNYLSFIYGRILFAQSLQTECFKSFSFRGNPRPGPPFVTNINFSFYATQR